MKQIQQQLPRDCYTGNEKRCVLCTCATKIDRILLSAVIDKTVTVITSNCQTDDFPVFQEVELSEYSDDIRFEAWRKWKY